MFIHILQGYCTGTVEIKWLSQHQLSNPKK